MPDSAGLRFRGARADDAQAIAALHAADHRLRLTTTTAW